MKIFKIFIEQTNFYNPFNEQAQKIYHKSHIIKPGHFKGYAQGHTLPSKWVFTCAIDVISTETNPTSLVSEASLFDLWVKPGVRAGVKTSDISEKLKSWHCSESIIEETLKQTGINP